MRPPHRFAPTLTEALQPLLDALGLSGALVLPDHDPRLHPAPHGHAAPLAGHDLPGLALLATRALQPSDRPALNAVAWAVRQHRDHLATTTQRNRLRDVYDHAFQFQGVVAPDGTFIDANATTLAFAATTRAAVLGRPFWDAPWWDTPAKRDAVRQAVQRAANGEFVRFDIEVTSAQGRHSIVDFSLTPVPGPDGQVDLIVPEGRDITEHHRAAREADVARAALSAVLENVQDAIVACDEHGRLTVFNRSSRDIHGVRDVTVHPNEWAQHFDLYEADGTTLLPTGRVPLVRAWNGEHLQNVEMVIAPHGQARRVLLASGGPLTAPDGTRMGAVIAMHDITERRNVENRLRHDAMHDRLTGLPNRTYLRHLLELAMDRYRRRPDAPYAVIYLDLDGFKHINDAYGHLMGDRVLLEVAARLRTAVRKSDTVARLGGDEFAVLLDAPCDEMNVMSVVRRVQAAMALPINLQGHQTPVTASIGATVATPAYRELDDPLRDADTAMYRAKRSGRNCSALFDQSMHDAVMQRVTLERELRRAIPAGELRLHYQPIVHLGTGTCTGFEALVRWQHPERGLLYPGHFMEVATSTGLVAPLGTWVIHETARQLAAWRAVPGLERLTVSVNLDDQQVQQSTRPEDQVLLFDLPEGLELEVTESSLFDTAEAVHALHTLASRGVPLSLDDFGTGYASLAAVQRHPISTLKIDRSFVAPLPGGNRQRAIVAGVITMAGHLGLRVVAEGLETQEQVQAVQDLGCTHGQGYLYSRPVPPEQALQYALTHQSPTPCS